ncbi:LOW QUALITY PROTEIN: CLEC16A/TT9, N-terminal, partial [Dillenia turbinata]
MGSICSLKPFATVASPFSRLRLNLLNFGETFIYLTEQLSRIHIVNEVNKDFVIEALRSIAELMTYGDQHGPNFFEFFMEKQVMAELSDKWGTEQKYDISACQKFGEVISFPTYVEAIRFAFHEESMICTAVRALTLNVYLVGDEGVNRFVTSRPHAEYFSNLVTFFGKQCLSLDKLVSEVSTSPSPEATSSVLGAVDEIEDNLYNFSDVISAGIPDDTQIGVVTSLYLLCCILQIVKIKDLANAIAAALFCAQETFVTIFGAKLNGYLSNHGMSQEYQQPDDDELDELMLDALGILPQCKQHKKLLLQALVGEGLGEEQLFSPENSIVRDGLNNEEQYGLYCPFLDVGPSAHLHRFQVLDTLASLFCRSNVSAETLWDGGWLLRQLLPYSEAEFSENHHKLLKDSYQKCCSDLLQEVNSICPDLLISVLYDEWKKCKRAIEASSPRKEPKSILLLSQRHSFEEAPSSESSFAAGERMSLYFFIKFKYSPLAEVCLINHLSIHLLIFLKTLEQNLQALMPLVESQGLIPCRIAFERGRERHFCFLAMAYMGGWFLLRNYPSNSGVVRVVAPLAGCNPKIDDMHARWLHLRIRPSTLPSVDPSKSTVYIQSKAKALVDGRWTLAFSDEESCKLALSIVLEESILQSSEVEKTLKPLLDLEKTVDGRNTFFPSSELEPFTGGQAGYGFQGKFWKNKVFGRFLVLFLFINSFDLKPQK